LAAETDLRRVVVEVRPLPGAVDAASGRPGVEVVRGKVEEVGVEGRGRWRRGSPGRQGRPTRGRERRPSYLHVLVRVTLRSVVFVTELVKS
jgi:hypothetical protein